MQKHNVFVWLTVVSLMLGALPISVMALPQAISSVADHTPNPTNVTIAGSLQSELGCPSDWQPECATTHLAYDSGDDVWQGTWTVPAGAYEYKAALNDSWTENYGVGAVPGGANIPLSLGGSTSVKFYYDHKTHWVTSNQNSVIAVAPGSFQSELGCSGDWQPDCLRTWLQDIDGDGIYTFETTALPAGNYEGKVALNESWDVNYGQGGVPGGANIPFTVPGPGFRVTFTFNTANNTPSVTVVSLGPKPDNNVEWDGLQPRFTRYALSHAGWRSSRRHAGHHPLPNVPQRRYLGQCEVLQRQPGWPTNCTDGVGRQ